jgi:hypothetical protein
MNYEKTNYTFFNNSTIFHNNIFNTCAMKQEPVYTPYYKWTYGKFILVGYLKEQHDGTKIKSKRDSRKV